MVKCFLFLLVYTIRAIDFEFGIDFGIQKHSARNKLSAEIEDYEDYPSGDGDTNTGTPIEQPEENDIQETESTTKQPLSLDTTPSTTAVVSSTHTDHQDPNNLSTATTRPDSTLVDGLIDNKFIKSSNEPDLANAIE